MSQSPKSEQGKSSRTLSRTISTKKAFALFQSRVIIFGTAFFLLQTMGKYKRKTERSLKFTAEVMENINRRPEAGESKRPIAEYSKVPESTLRKRLRMGTVPTSIGRFKATFSDEEEKELAEYRKDLDAKFYGLTIIIMLKELAFEYAGRKEIAHRFNRVKKTTGKDWMTSFCKRQNLSVRLPEECGLGRITSFNEVEVNRFFYNLRAVFEKHNFPPNRIFNLDESGLSTVPNKLTKVIAEKGKRIVGKIVSADRGQLLTVVCCFSRSGVYVPPAIIFPRKRMCNELYSEAPIGTLSLMSDTGYMKKDLFVQWLHHFQNNVKATETDPVLLVSDNHISHCSLEAVIFCRVNHITLLSIPPHGSHKIQPLDCGFFGPLK
jgi:hypothetical protein